MAVVQVRKVRMAVGKGRMPVTMGMRFARRIVRSVFMLVMFVMNMAVLVFDGVVAMLMLMPFDKVEIETEAHQNCCR